MSTVVQTPLFTQTTPEKGAAKGHVHFDIKSGSAPDIALCAFLANVSASLLFEKMHAQGTNILLQLEKDNARADVLARYENDGVALTWVPKQMDNSSLGSAQERISNKTFMIGKGSPLPKGEVPPTQVPTSLQDADLSEEEENFLIKQLHRIP